MSVSLFCDSLLGGAAAGRTAADRQRSSTRQDTTDAVLSSITFKTTHAEITFPKTNILQKVQNRVHVHNYKRYRVT